MGEALDRWVEEGLITKAQIEEYIRPASDYDREVVTVVLAHFAPIIALNVIHAIEDRYRQAGEYMTGVGDENTAAINRIVASQLCESRMDIEEAIDEYQ